MSVWLCVNVGCFFVCVSVNIDTKFNTKLAKNVCTNLCVKQNTFKVSMAMTIVNRCPFNYIACKTMHFFNAQIMYGSKVLKN